LCDFVSLHFHFPYVYCGWDVINPFFVYNGCVMVKLVRQSAQENVDRVFAKLDWHILFYEKRGQEIALLRKQVCWLEERVSQLETRGA
jgi:hypothetical protein